MTPLESNQPRLDSHDGRRMSGLDSPLALTANTASSVIGTRSAADSPAVLRYAADDDEFEQAPELESRRLATYLAEDDPLTRGTMLWLRYAVLLAITSVVLTVVATLI
jgi:hypothetical protein